MLEESPSRADTLDTADIAATLCPCGAGTDERSGGCCRLCGRNLTHGGTETPQTVSFCGEVGSGTTFHLADGPDRSGEQLGHFRLLSKLGYGGMGAVYRGLDESLQRLVAVKVIRSQSGNNSLPPKQVNRLLDEAVAQARLNHPHVVTIYYVGRSSRDPFFAMELLPGPTLAQRIQDTPLPYSDVIRFARQIVSALKQASTIGLVHGDIKPSNLILADDDTVKLSDFGLAHTDTGAPHTGGVSGTLSYMAPELSMGSDPSAQSDMYSLGVTLFELTFGRRPYALTGDTLQQQLASQLEACVEFPEKWPQAVPERWRAVIERLLSREPANRYENYEAFENDLALLAPVGVTTAGILNRGLAWLVDLTFQTGLMLPLTLAAVMSSTSESQIPVALLPFARNYGWIGIFALLVPAVFAWMEWLGWRTLGRYLFQLRVADEHGLRLSRRKQVLRSLVRNLPIWTTALCTLLTSLGWQEIAIFILPIDDVVLLINMIPILGPRRLAVHDRLFRSHVVLDTGT